MHPRLDEVMTLARTTREELLATLRTLAPGQWNARSPDGGWTVAEVVEHVRLSEDGSIRALFRALRNARKAGLAEESSTESVAGRLDASLIVDSPVRRVAPDMVVPKDVPPPGELLERIATTRSGLETWALEADGFALGDVRFPHPALGDIDLYQWVLFLAHHDRRHQRQVAAILGAPRPAMPFTNPAADSKAAGAAYAAGLVALLGDRDPLAVWRELPDAVDELVAGVSDDDARRPEGPGKWSIAQVVSHLVDSEVVYGYRIRRIVAEDSPAIRGYAQDRWAERLGYNDEALADLRPELRTLRARNLRFIERLGDAELDRCGVHDERGTESVRHLVRLLAGHDLVHRAQLARIRRAIGLDA